MSIYQSAQPLSAGLLCAAGLLFLSSAAYAADPSQAFQFVFTPAKQKVSPNMPATFSASITNTTTDALYINGDALDPLASGLTADDTSFFNTFLVGAPVQLGAGQTYSFTDLFTVTDDGAALDSYTGRFTLYGGTTLDAQDFSGSQTFTVQTVPDRVQAVPEASTWVSLGLMLMLGTVAVTARKKKAAGTA